MIIVPPGGFAGFSQMTMASKRALQKGGVARATGGKRRRRTVKARSTKRRKARSKKPARLVKGSAAAKAYMAKIRRKRRK